MDNVPGMQSILAHFGFRQGDCQFSELPGGTADPNYAIVSGGRTFILRRRNAGTSSYSRLRFEEEYLDYLTAQNIPVPVPVRGAGGRSWIRLRGNVYQLHTYLDGSAYEPNNVRQMAQAGAFLGKLHGAASGFAPAKTKKSSRYDAPDRIVHAVRQTLKDHALQADSEEIELLDYIYKVAKELQLMMPDSRYRRLYKLVIHGNYRPAGVKYCGDRVCGLFDFDRIGMQPRIRDVVDGIVYFSTIRPDGADGADIFSLTQPCRLDLERIGIFIASYQAACHRPLDADEIAAAPYMIKAGLLDNRVAALARMPADRHVETLTKGIFEPLTWLDTHGEALVACLETAAAARHN